MMAATAVATHISLDFSSITVSGTPSSLFVYKTTGLRTTLCKRISLVRASSKPQTERPDPAAFVSQEDVKYLVKLGAGSIAGAAAIKYGSVIFPEITRPNLAQALFMIFAPVILAVFLLIKQSRLD